MTLAASPRTAILEHRQRRRARPTAFTPATRNIILEHTRHGAYPSTAANKAGIHYQTLKGWLDKGYQYVLAEETEGIKLRPQEREFAAFYRQYMEAEADHEMACLQDTEEIARSTHSWAGLMTVMERRYPSRWKRQDQVEHIGQAPAARVKEVDQSPERLAGVAAILIDQGIFNQLLQAAASGAGAGGPVIDAKADEVHNGEATGGPQQAAP